jgi:hypothetical protein
LRSFTAQARPGHAALGCSFAHRQDSPSLIPFIDPPLTADQVKLLKADNVVSDEAKRENRTLAGIGIPQTTVEAILPSYLARYRPHGQYSGTGSEA